MASAGYLSAVPLRRFYVAVNLKCSSVISLAEYLPVLWEGFFW